MRYLHFCAHEQFGPDYGREVLPKLGAGLGV